MIPKKSLLHFVFESSVSLSMKFKHKLVSLYYGDFTLNILLCHSLPVFPFTVLSNMCLKNHFIFLLLWKQGTILQHWAYAFMSRWEMLCGTGWSWVLQVQLLYKHHSFQWGFLWKVHKAGYRDGLFWTEKRNMFNHWSKILSPMLVSHMFVRHTAHSDYF